MMLPAFCLLAGCSALSSAEPVRSRAPASLTAPVPGPVALPDRGLTMTEVEIYWGRDRSALRQCQGQVMGLADWANLNPKRS